MSTNLSDNEKICCTVLAYLFLNPGDNTSIYDMIATRLYNNNISIAMANDILYYDLYPLLCWNLVSPAYESYGFDTDWVCAMVLQRRRNVRWIHRARLAVEWALFSGQIGSQWNEIQQRYT